MIHGAWLWRPSSSNPVGPSKQLRKSRHRETADRCSLIPTLRGTWRNPLNDETIKTTTYAERRRLQYQIVLHLFNRQVFREFRFEERYIIIVLLCFCSLTAISTYVQRITAGISYDNIYFLYIIDWFSPQR